MSFPLRPPSRSALSAPPARRSPAFPALLVLPVVFLLTAGCSTEASRALVREEKYARMAQEHFDDKHRVSPRAEEVRRSTEDLGARRFLQGDRWGPYSSPFFY